MLCVILLHLKVDIAIIYTSPKIGSSISYHTTNCQLGELLSPSVALPCLTTMVTVSVDINLLSSQRKLQRQPQLASSRRHKLLPDPGSAQRRRHNRETRLKWEQNEKSEKPLRKNIFKWKLSDSKGHIVSLKCHFLTGKVSVSQLQLVGGCQSSASSTAFCPVYEESPSLGMPCWKWDKRPTTISNVCVWV